MKLFLILLTLLFTTPASGWIVETLDFHTDDSPFVGFKNNAHDIHMSFDGRYIWIPETEFWFCPSKSIFGSYISRYDTLNPDARERWELDTDYSDLTVVYESKCGIADPNLMYISAMYSAVKGIYIFDKTTGLSTFYDETANNMFAGVNGARFVITDIDGTDYAFTGGFDAIVLKWNTETQAVIQYDFGPQVTAVYGIAKVPYPGQDVIYIAGGDGDLIMLPDDATVVGDANVDDLRSSIVGAPADLQMTAMTYDGTNIWIAVRSDTLEIFGKFGFCKYTPPATIGQDGVGVLYWSEAYFNGGVAAIENINGMVYMANEEFISTTVAATPPVDGECLWKPTYETDHPQLMSINTTTFTQNYQTIREAIRDDRALAGMGVDNKGYLYLGGYGYDTNGFEVNIYKVNTNTGLSISYTNLSNVILN